jgi:hypothetical protein
MHIFLTSAQVGGGWSASRPGRFTPRERTSITRWRGGQVGPTASLDDVEKRKFLTLQGLELRPLGRPARSQSLYRPRYPASLALCEMQLFISIIRHVAACAATSELCVVLPASGKFSSDSNCLS